tara:strand:+ start:132 stop:866 length:735 start_codon:yes stop_codon:yes gene_type:complete
MAFLTNAQITVSNDLYTVIYSESYEQPLELTYSYPQFRATKISDQIEYKLKLSKLGVGERLDAGNPSGLGEFFSISYPSPSVSKIYSWEVPEGIITSDDADYEDNDYDRGHLVPIKQFDDFKNISFLYSYLNCALMHETLNSGVWSSLEEYERNLPGSVSVTVRLTFSDKNKKVKGGATIPTYFTKIIEYGGSYTLDDNDDGEFRTFSKKVLREVYEFPNDASVKGKKIDEFKIGHLSGQFRKE